MAIKKVIGSGRRIEAGKLVTYRQDFAAHYTGGSFRHTADQIDMSPEIAGFEAPNVQETLELMGAAIGTGASFVSIGDGYRVGEFNVGGLVTLKDAFDLAFADPQLQQGGIILLKAGVYHTDTTIEVPPGISIMGEVAGTYVFGQTAVVFQFLAGEQPNERWGGESPVLTGPSYQTNKLFNMIIGDNLDGAADAGTTALPKVTSFVQLDRGSNVEISNVSFIGRFGFVAGVIDTTQLTTRAIIYTDSGSTDVRTSLKVDSCYFDNMLSGIQFTQQAGLAGTFNFLKVTNCRARTTGITGDTTRTGFVEATPNMEGGVANNFHSIASLEGADSAYFLHLLAPVNAIDVGAGFTVIGNSGGVDPAILGSAIFMDNDAGSGLWRGIVSGNTWGSSGNNPWYVIVGDGVQSLGDINGASALDTLASLSAPGLTTPTTIYVGKGDYTITNTAADNQRFNLIGLERDFEKPTVTIVGGGATDPLTRPTVFLGTRIENIKFKSSETFSSVTLGLETITPPTVVSGLYVNNCEFWDAAVIIGSEDEECPTSVVENCYFTADVGAVYNTDRFLILSEKIKKVVIRNCLCEPQEGATRMHYLGGVYNFGDLLAGTVGTGYDSVFSDGYTDGYGLSLPNGDPLLATISLENVSYFLGALPVADMLNTSYPVSLNPEVTEFIAAWTVINPSAVVTMTDCQFIGTLASISIVDPAILTDGVAISWVGLFCLEATIINCGMVSTYQTWLNTLTEKRPAATLACATTGAVLIDNCILEGPSPCYIGGDDGLQDGFLTVTSSLFRAHWPGGEFESMAFIANWNTSTAGDKGSAIIKGNTFIHNSETPSGGAELLPPISGPSDVPGSIIIQGNNRSIVFEGNIIDVSYSATGLSEYVPNEFYGVSISGGAGGDIKDLMMSNNIIKYKVAYDLNIDLALTYVNGPGLTMSDNRFTYEPTMPDTSLTDTYVMRYSVVGPPETTGPSPSIQGNSFHLISGPGLLGWNRPVEALGNAGEQRGSFIDNAFTRNDQSIEADAILPGNNFINFTYRWMLEPNLGASYIIFTPAAGGQLYLENAGGTEDVLYGETGIVVPKIVNGGSISTPFPFYTEWTAPGLSNFFYIVSLSSLAPLNSKIRLITITLNGGITIPAGDLTTILTGSNGSGDFITNAAPFVGGVPYLINDAAGELVPVTSSSLGSLVGTLSLRAVNITGVAGPMFLQLRTFYTY